MAKIPPIHHRGSSSRWVSAAMKPRDGSIGSPLLWCTSRSGSEHTSDTSAKASAARNSAW